MTEKQKKAVLIVGLLLLFVAMLIASLVSSGALSFRSNDDGGGVRYNINTATVAQLETVYGLDRETAIEIVTYRERYGRFYTVEDLLDVPTVTNEQYLKASAFLVCE